MGERIPIERWGRDHWSTLAYIETCVVDNRGVPDVERMRCNVSLHPAHANRANHLPGATKNYPTRLADGEELEHHDDWSCLEDAEEAGLLVCDGTGLSPVYGLTDLGRSVVAALRAHRAEGLGYASFRWPVGTR